jgi:hypothetical protein
VIFWSREERADKLSGAWGRHPLLGRMYLPAYRAGTEKVAELAQELTRRKKCFRSSTAAIGLVDIQTIDKILQGE